MKISTIFFALAVVCISGCASNKPAKSDGKSIVSLSPGGVLLIGFNRNDDYVIDRSEFSLGRVGAFNNADRNSDGVINSSEFRAWQPKAVGSQSALPNLVYFDRNFNDRITHKEFEVGLEKMFNDADKNSDNEVSYQELVTIVSPPEARQRQGRGGRGSGEGRRGGRRGGNSTSF